jgi:rubrerythrin
VDGLWLRDLESLEAISQDDDTRRIFLRMAELQHAGRTSTFLDELEDDPEVDEDVKGSLAEIAQDAAFLLALEDYVHRTRAIH